MELLVNKTVSGKVPWFLIVNSNAAPGLTRAAGMMGVSVFLQDIIVITVIDKRKITAFKRGRIALFFIVARLDNA